MSEWGAASAGEVPGGPCRVDRRYLLALNITLREFDGQYWADSSWAKDLEKHLAYLPDLTLFCPVRHQPPEPGWKAVGGPGFRVAGYGAPSSIWSMALRLPLILPKLWREVGRAEIVHSGVAGWPMPLGWFAAPFARMRDKKLVLIVESAFWRPSHGNTPGRFRRAQANVWEGMARWCMAKADYAAYTQGEYRASLPAPRAGGGRIVQASWIEAADCVDENVAIASWEAKADQTPRFLFATRMIPEKGCQVLAKSFALLAKAKADVVIDIMGEGPEVDGMRAAADTPWGRDHVHFLPPRPYGAGFFSLVAQYHAILAPSLSDEQPRIVYDGYSQAVPTIGSDLPGLKACIDDGISGQLVPSGDAKALAEAMIGADPKTLQRWGLAGLVRAEAVTHDKLHLDRCRDLNAMFGDALCVVPAGVAPVVMPEVAVG